MTCGWSLGRAKGEVSLGSQSSCVMMCALVKELAIGKEKMDEVPRGCGELKKAWLR